MYAKRKLLLGILSAVIFVCAAVLLILPLRTSVVRAQMTQDPVNYTKLAIETQDQGISLEAGMQAEDLKEHITVTAYYDGGSDVLSPDDYTLSLREGGLLTAGQNNTLVATIKRGTATGSVSLPEVETSTKNVITRIVITGSGRVYSTDNEQGVKNALSGTVYFSSNLTGYALRDYIGNVGWSIEYDDLRPDSETEAQQDTYKRTVTVSCINTEGKTVTSVGFDVDVQWVKPLSLGAIAQTGTLIAGQPVEADDFTVIVTYRDTFGMYVTRNLNFGEYTIEYQNGEVINFNDEYITIKYIEGDEEFTWRINFSISNITISEEIITAPSLVLPAAHEYVGKDITWTFNDYNEKTSTVNVALAETDVEYVVTFSARDVDEYKVIFNAK